MIARIRVLFRLDGIEFIQAGAVTKLSVQGDLRKQ